MTIADRRRFPRIRSLNLLSYVCLDEDDNPVQQGMGRTLDVSEGGILMETHTAIDTRYILFLSLGLGDSVADIKGRVVYSRKNQIGRVESGIEFEEETELQRQVVRKYLSAFKEYQKGTKESFTSGIKMEPHR
jgi:hypothetical protein